MIADADYPVPVLHEVWSPVVCHNRDEIQRDPGIRDFWGKSIRTFVEKSARTQGASVEQCWLAWMRTAALKG